MVNPNEKPKREKLVSETWSTVSGAIVGNALGGIAVTTAAAAQFLKNGVGTESIVKNVGEASEKVMKNPRKSAALVYGTVIGATVLGAIIGNRSAKAKNEKYTETKHQLDQAANVISNQERELNSLRNEAPGARAKFAEMAGERSGSHADRVNEQKAIAALSELGL